MRLIAARNLIGSMKVMTLSGKGNLPEPAATALQIATGQISSI
jgi:hypothetical protein